MRYILSLLAVVAVAFGQAAPSITNITNAAIPAMDFPANSVALAPGSMAIIFGTKLADFTASAPPPWQKALGGVEVHLVEDSCYDSSCELVADLIYASPTQINFVVPDVPLYGTPNAHVWNTRIVLVKNGERFDDRTRILGGPGRIYIDAVYGYADWAVFGVGYDCLYSFSLSDPSACGLSWSEGQHRAMLGAVTDAISGQLITTQNPVHQGQLLTLWMTGLTGDPWFSGKTSFCFGVAQYGKDLPSGEGWCQNSNSPTMPGMWAGKSPEFPGLDQANVTFPVCTNSTLAATEKRYDVFLTFSGHTKVSQFSSGGTTVRIYLPFVVNKGDSDCDWHLKTTTTTLQSSPNPSSFGQVVNIYATVSPSAATGTVSFFDGTTLLGSGTIGSYYTASISTSSLSVGDHSIVAIYNGDGQYAKSSTKPLTHTVRVSTTTTITSDTNPSMSGQSVIFTAVVSPSEATGKVTFFNGTSTIGSGTVIGGKATCSINKLGVGSIVITATYGGDTKYGSSSGTMTQIVMGSTTTVLTSPTQAAIGQSVTFTATVSPCCIATGTVTFFDGSTTLGSSKLVSQKATFSTSSLSVGTHSITARYSGDVNDNASTSTALTLTIWTITLTSSPNPSTFGQMVTFTACGIASGASGTLAFLDGTTTLGTNNYVASPCSTYGTNVLSIGTHSITARYSDGGPSVTLTQTVNKP